MDRTSAISAHHPFWFDDDRNGSRAGELSHASLGIDAPRRSDLASAH